MAKGDIIRALLGMKHSPAGKKYLASKKGFDPEGIGYDSITAKEAGMKRNKMGHLGSLDPRTGMVLKGRKHPTWHLMAEEETRRKSKIIKKEGRYYSVPISKQKKRIAQGIAEGIKKKRDK